MEPDKLLRKILDDYQINSWTNDSIPDDHSVSPPLRGRASRAVLSVCDEELYLALYSAERQFKQDKLCRALGRDCRIADEQTIGQRLSRYSRAPIPLNTRGGLHILIDEALSDADYLIYHTDSEQPAILIDMEGLHPVISDEKIGISFSVANEVEAVPNESDFTIKLSERMKSLRELPPMPETVTSLLTLRDRYEVNTDHLISIIDKDPVLTTQVISYANSAFFGQIGSVTSLKDAIFRVLGVNAVVDLALGVSVGRVLSIPDDGILGARRLWRHSTYSAALMQKLTMQMPWGERPDIGSAYLAGLLHDIGFFVLGYLFPQEHRALSRLVDAHPQVAISRLEYNLMGMNHCELGQMAMRLWQMPPVIINVVRYHHTPNYSGEDAVLIRLLNLVECLLSSQGLTDTPVMELDETLLTSLGLEEDDVILAADEVIQTGTTLDQLANQMCA